MSQNNIQNKESERETFDDLHHVDSCEVSKASVEIMLERFCNGKDIDFPFSQYLG